MKKLISILLIIAVFSGIGVTGITAHAGTFTTKSAYTGKTYTHFSKFANRLIKNCIDVSEHNGAINWYAVKSAGVTNAIIRVGYRGYGVAGNMAEDNYFTENVESAQKAGMNVGFYFYSQAVTVNEAADEAKFVLARVKKYNFTLPIFYDYEFAGVSDGRLDKAWNNGTLNKTKMTNNAVAFCKTIMAAGYKAGVYASASFFTVNLDADKLVKNGYIIWLAYYTTNSAYGSYWHKSNQDYDYWQYSSVGNVTGVCGAPGQVWLKATYGKNTGYIRLDNLLFTSAKAAVTANTKGVNMRAGKGTGYAVVQKLPNNAKVTLSEYPVRNCDVNFYYAKTAKTNFPFSLKAGVRNITVSWAKQAKADFYRVYSYDSKSGKYKRLDQLEGDKTSFVDKNLKDNQTKTYLVRWFYKDGETTVGSNYKKSDNKSATTAPAKVNFTSKDIRTTALTLSWGKINGASFYKVYRYDTSTKKYTNLAKVTALKYKVNKLQANTKYTYIVRAFNKNNLGSDYTVSDNKVFRTAPPAPTFTFKRYTDKIDISWKKVTGATSYTVYSYDKSAKKYSELGDTKALTFTHDSLNPNTEYTYLVRACNSSVAKSDYSLSKNKSVKTLIAKPEFKLSLSGNDINVSWNKVAGAERYVVYTYNTAENKYTAVGKTKALNYTLGALPFNTEYTVLVRAYDKSDVGNTYSVDDNKKRTTPPAAPDFNLKEASNSVSISWKAVKGASFYRVYSYNTGNKKYTALADVTSLSFKHTSLKSNTNYTYLVRAYNSAKSGSAYTVDSNRKIKTLPAKPVLKAQASSNSVKLSWNKVAGAAVYKIYRYDSVLGTYSKLANTKNLTYSVKNLTSKTNYAFLVRAYNSDNKGNSYTVADNISVTTK